MQRISDSPLPFPDWMDIAWEVLRFVNSRFPNPIPSIGKQEPKERYRGFKEQDTGFGVSPSPSDSPFPFPDSGDAA
ncbi:hypothetical protein N9Z28_01585 [Akkermansiaceae bacterium]|nr:hypothetical protein [Akkermansiaceae bacterium]